MKNQTRLFWILIGSVFLASCIKVELKDERVIPEFYQVVLVTHTPSGMIVEQATATQPPPPTTTKAPAPTATPLPSPTQTSIPSPTPVSPTPIPGAVVSMNAWCRKGPGTIYPGLSYLSGGEQVTLLGRNPEATWWLVQKGDGSQSCWASAAVIELKGVSPDLAIMPAPPTPYQGLPIQSGATATQRPRQKPAKSTPIVPPAATNTPDPYPYPAP